MLSKLLEAKGFSENPFASTNADKEPNLSAYFVPPPYFTSVKGDPRSPKSNVIFAPRGAGKTAQKVMLERYAEAELDNPFLCVTYDVFRSIPRSEIGMIGVDWHLEQVIQRLLSAVLALIEENKLRSLSGDDKKVLAYCFDRYLGSLTASEANTILNSIKNDLDRVTDFARKNGRNLTKLAAAIPTIFGLLPLDLEFVKSEIRHEPASFIIERLVSIIRNLGYNSIYVLVDRVDEIAEFSNDARECARFIQPLATELNLLETDGLAFKFFLWDQMKEPLISGGLRSDRIILHNLNWSADKLSDMLSKRLSAFSNGKITHLGELVSSSVEVDLHRLVCVLGNGSPRDAIRLVGRIIDEHTRLEDSPRRIEWSSIEKGIRKYARERSIELYGANKVEDLNKIERSSFPISFVANDVFRINLQSARVKIQNMMSVGALTKSGDIENPGNRPLHQYSVVDPRLACEIMSSFSIKDVLRDFLFKCPRCSAILAREGEEAMCHECSMEFPLEDEYSVLVDCLF